MKLYSSTGRVFDLQDRDPDFGNGGEAVVYVDPESGLAFKLYRLPTDSLFVSQSAREGAAIRLHDYPDKLREFPVELSIEVVRPAMLLYNEAGQFVGYAMQYIDGAIQLTDLLDPTIRAQKGYNLNFVTRVFINLHDLIRKVHAAKAIISDLSPNNVLVMPDASVYLIDADGMAFNGYPDMGFTPHYVDPRRYIGEGETPEKRATTASDWYAFAVILFNALLNIRPYEGGALVDMLTRMRQRMTVFHKDVGYPSLATPFTHLPAPLMDYFRGVFVRDVRGEFPRQLLDMFWVRCSSCQQWYARAVCPTCLPPIVGNLTRDERSASRGTSVPPASKGPHAYFSVLGAHIRTAVFTDYLRLAYTYQGTLMREGSRVVGSDDSSAEHYAICGRATLVGGKGLVEADFLPDKLVGDRIASVAGRPGFAANSRFAYALRGAQIMPLTTRTITNDCTVQLSAEHTWFWVGEATGFAMSRTTNGEVHGTIFSTDSSGPRTIVTARLDKLRGTIGKVGCYFGGDAIWLLCQVTYRDQKYVCVYVWDNDGTARVNGQMYPAAQYMREVIGHAAYGSSLWMLAIGDVYELGTAAGQITVSRYMPKIIAYGWPTAYLVAGEDDVCYVVDTTTVQQVRLPR